MKKKLIIILEIVLVILLGFIVYNNIYTRDTKILSGGSNEKTGSIIEDCPITSNQETAKCYADIAIKQNDYSICERLPESVRSWGLDCYIELAVKQGDKTICGLINNISGWATQSIIDQCLDMVIKGEVTPLAFNDLGKLEYIQDELTSTESQAKSIIRKQLTFIGNKNYNIDSLNINNSLESIQMGFGGYPNTVNVNCSKISSLSISNSEEISGVISTYYCPGDEDLNILKDQYNFKIIFDHFLVSLEFRGKKNSLVPELEGLMINNLENEWENLEETDWPRFERISPLDIYTFNSNYYETSILKNASFFNTAQKNNRNNFFVISTIYNRYLDGRVFVYNDIDVKSMNLLDLSNFYRTSEGYDNIEEIDCPECNYKGYLLSKKGLDPILGDNGTERLNLRCGNKVVYISNNIIFEMSVTERNSYLTNNECGDKNIKDCANSFKCLDESQKTLLLEEAKKQMDFIMIPFEKEKITIRDTSIKINGINYLYDYFNNKRTNIKVDCLIDDDCQTIITSPCKAIYAASKDNKQENIELFIESTGQSLQKSGVNCSELDLNSIPLCRNNICSYQLAEY